MVFYILYFNTQRSMTSFDDCVDIWLLTESIGRNNGLREANTILFTLILASQIMDFISTSEWSLRCFSSKYGIDLWTSDWRSKIPLTILVTLLVRYCNQFILGDRFENWHFLGRICQLIFLESYSNSVFFASEIHFSISLKLFHSSFLNCLSNVTSIY